MIKELLNKEIKAWQVMIIYLIIIITGFIGTNLSAPKSFLYKISEGLIFTGTGALALIVLILLAIFFADLEYKTKPIRQN